MLLSVLYGTEAMTVLKDTYGLSREEVIELTTWGANALLQHTLTESQSESAP
ncbi:MAG: hypothetical protein XXXJIFNMEKO3_00755 [Candidatus Erwinia impunctatus]|nr:hypothetical protein XXXJIFNMEKO_00755 [Culicoides impunctatus]